MRSILLTMFVACLLGLGCGTYSKLPEAVSDAGTDRPNDAATDAADDAGTAADTGTQPDGGPTPMIPCELARPNGMPMPGMAPGPEELIDAVGVQDCEDGQCAYRCPPGEQCDYTCPDGGCLFRCEGDCTACCGAGRCRMVCAAGATCQFDCGGGCTIDCVGGDCPTASCRNDDCTCLGVECTSQP